MLIMISDDCITSIEPTETFERDEGNILTAEDEREADQLLEDERLKRKDPEAFAKLVLQRQLEAALRWWTTASSAERRRKINSVVERIAVENGLLLIAIRNHGVIPIELPARRRDRRIDAALRGAGLGRSEKSRL